jgi:hypothetical protein
VDEQDQGETDREESEDIRRMAVRVSFDKFIKEMSFINVAR